VRGVVRGHVETTLGVLRDHLAEPWTLHSLANEMHLSHSQLLRAFDAVTSPGPVAYPRLMRVQQMTRLLTRSDLPISAIARAAGWTDANRAGRCFHAHYAIPPPSTAGSTLRCGEGVGADDVQSEHRGMSAEAAASTAAGESGDAVGGRGIRVQHGLQPVRSAATTIAMRASQRAWSMSAASSGRRENR
jgi:AraC-like DNA-binding protein